MEESDYWKKLALWLLDCEAATTEGLLSRKSGSKYEKSRHQILPLIGYWNEQNHVTVN